MKNNNYDSEDYVPDDIYIEGNEEDRDYYRVPKKKKEFRGSSKSYVILALISAILGGIISNYIGPLLYGKILPYPSDREYNGAKNEISINTSDDIDAVTAVAKKAMSSVVGITTLETQHFFFEERDVEGIGSGVIVNSDGYILTNSHVVADGNAKEIKVLFDNGEKEEGRVLWNDPSLDLAVVKVDIKNLPTAILGNSDEIEVGELAIAIGNPLGLEFERTVTSGIISGLNRSVKIDESTIIDELIQTDASINPGNSGGPLLNKKGEVIGINTAKIGTAEGLGFSIPINIAKSIIKEVIDTGTYETVALGIVGLDAVEYQARIGIDLGIETGVFVLDIQKGSSADKAGIEVGDIITKLDGKDVETMQSMKKLLYKYKKGDTAKLEVIRNKEKKEIEVSFKRSK